LNDFNLSAAIERRSVGFSNSCSGRYDDDDVVRYQGDRPAPLVPTSLAASAGFELQAQPPVVKRNHEGPAGGVGSAKATFSDEVMNEARNAAKSALKRKFAKKSSPR
jgi:hypothetical protein